MMPLKAGAFVLFLAILSSGFVANCDKANSGQNEAYHDASSPGCEVLNYEKVADFMPETIEVEGVLLRLLGQIQHGATSKVYHALYEDAEGQKQCVAVKLVDMARIELHKQNQVTNEADLLRQLNDKKVAGIPLLYAMEHHPTKQTMRMVLELAHHDLFDEITPKLGRRKFTWVRRTFGDILRALQPVHDNGIVHGDLKPENMAYFQSPQGQMVLKVIDFGGAMREHQLPTACTEIVTGTVMYMSPEQVAWCGAHGEEEYLERRKENPLSRKSDIWSIGIILYQMLFGHNPYNWIMSKYDDLDESERTEKSDAEMREAIFSGQRQLEFGQYEDSPVLEMLKRCLDRNPTKRPEVPELLAELEKLVELEEKLKKIEEEVDELVKNVNNEEDKVNGNEKEKEENKEEKKEEDNEDEKEDGNVVEMVQVIEQDAEADNTEEEEEEEAMKQSTPEEPKKEAKVIIAVREVRKETEANEADAETDAVEEATKQPIPDEAEEEEKSIKAMEEVQNALANETKAMPTEGGKEAEAKLAPATIPILSINGSMTEGNVFSPPFILHVKNIRGAKQAEEEEKSMKAIEELKNAMANETKTMSVEGGEEEAKLANETVQILSANGSMTERDAFSLPFMFHLKNIRRAFPAVMK